MNKETTKTLPVLDMSCAVCANNVEHTVAEMEGVKNAVVNFATHTLTVTYDGDVISLDKMKTEVQAVGYDLIIEEENASEVQEDIEAKRYRLLRRNVIGAWTFAIPLAVLGMFFMHIPYANWIMLFLALSIMLLFGREFYVNGLKHALKGSANMDTLVALSTLIAFIFSLFNTVYPQFWYDRGLEPHVYYEASGVIIAFVLLGKLLEERAKRNTSSAIKGLMGLQPKTAYRVSSDGTEEEVMISQLQTGDLIRVHPGERIPVDGVVTEGVSSIDESMLSGEVIPVVKQAGSKAMAGTINQQGAFVMQATGVGEATMLARIVRMVQEAQGSKAPVQRIVDKISRIFVPVVMAISVLTFAVWMLIGGEAYFSHALMSAVSVLVIACPCALGLATPTALMVGMGKAANHQILIKDAYALENMCKIDTVVLDKTGTLTEGKPSVVDSYWFSESKKIYLDVLFTAEKKSEHPLSIALLEWLEESGASMIEVDNFESCVGRGIKMNVKDRTYWVGNRAFKDSFDVQLASEAKLVVKDWSKKANTIIYYGCGSTLLAMIAIADSMKMTSPQAVGLLKKKGIDVHLLTGDREEVAKATAKEAGIENYKADVLPEGKEDYIKELQAKGKIVAMVGDGINDSQALARADVSIAMGKGTDIAMDIAMVTLMTSDLLRLPEAIRLSKQTVKHIRQNLFWAFIYNLIGIPLAAGILYPVNGMLLDPMLASAAMAFSSVSVVLNSLRLKYTN
ncbi:heavy metal translocating P-type ATPase [Massilibacteroides sp.]|uniref:heavy metal translocating P-type ATPase n=1 Tax=Massilibacteroides sp. TaxID=2034766 RepID=UPI00260E1B0D|nr:heavy metal translocating P-type ATPase [Massilibacteroides sp.]MDD4516654.1 heavy metal translocating P-type ATPase [Massilibacteroides sp.]